LISASGAGVVAAIVPTSNTAARVPPGKPAICGWPSRSMANAACNSGCTSGDSFSPGLPGTVPSACTGAVVITVRPQVLDTSDRLVPLSTFSPIRVASSVSAALCFSAVSAVTISGRA